MTRFALECSSLVVGLFLSACNSSSGPSSTQEEDQFAVSDASVPPLATWRINQPIDISFNQDVDFDSVNSNTINIAAVNGIPATGSFDLLPNGRTVRFQPSCPTLPDNSDAGLKPGGFKYRLHVLGSQGSGSTVQSTDGDPLDQGFSVEFFTPDTEDPQELFLDTVAGPPAPRVRGKGGVPLDDPTATYLELGEDSDTRVYFVWNSGTQTGELEDAEMEVPLNLYSIPEERVAIVLSLNQPINPAANNVSTQNVQLEFQSGAAGWESVATRLELIGNCTETGSSLRLEPIGLLPQGSGLRVIIRDGFGDLTGDETVLDLVGFAQMTTATAFDPGTQTPGDGADEVLEPFATSELEDTGAAFATPHADWQDGKLSASFPFGGTGGPNGNFDWHIPPNTELILNTSTATIVGGPGGDPTTTQLVINGLVDIRDLFVPASSSLIIQGPNVCTILATGQVKVDGRISVDGSSNKGVGTLNTTNQPEPGAAGNAGGGKGGTANYLTNQSTPRGGSGFGAFNLPNGGGQGGETSYCSGGILCRRGAGGGGGSFGADTLYSYGPGFTELVRCQEIIGLDAEEGCGGGIDPGKGAESQTERAQGGFPATRPFFDENDDNDFLGTMLTADGELILGELDAVWAGSGGGGGGNSVDSDTFPLNPFSNQGDEKGCGGAGAAGGLRLLAHGPIQVRKPSGTITAHGGQGGGGENPQSGGFSHVGGGSGGGAGGHIVLSSASFISIEGQAETAGEWFNDYRELGTWDEHEFRVLSAVGGQGGAGRNDKGGSSGNGDRTIWRCDGIKLDLFAESTGGGISHNPPRDDNGANNCWGTTQLPDLNDSLGPVLASGGDGGPGIIQLHVDDPALNLRFPDITEAGQFYGGAGVEGIDVSKACSPPPEGWKAGFLAVPSDRMIPFFGKESTGQSVWLALGLARVTPSGGTDQVRFFFDGIDTADGSVLRDGEEQQELPPLLGPVALASEPDLPHIDVADPLTIVMDASGLAVEDDVYKRNAALLRLFTVRLQDSDVETNVQDHEVATASYDPASDQLTLTVFPVGANTLEDFIAGGDVMVSVIPFHLKVITSGAPLAYPADSQVTVTFEATIADSEGNPDESASTGLVTEIDDLNQAQYDFFRFRVHFNLSTSGQQVDGDTLKPGLDFMRIPFRF